MLNVIKTIWASAKEGFFLKSITSAGLVALLIKLFGDNYIIYEALMILVIIDFLTGIICSFRNGKKITSFGMTRTIKKVMLYAFFMISVHQLYRITLYLNWIQIFAITFLAITELLSIIENLSRAGILIPKWVTKRLTKYIETGEFNSRA